MTLSSPARRQLWLQRILGLLAFPIIGTLAVFTMRWVMGYKIVGLRDVRRQFRQICRQHGGPLLICANHLTMVDSAIINWALASNLAYWCRYRLFPWNIPERQNFWSIWALRTVCYLSKCIPIERNGPVEGKRQTVDKLVYLLQQREVVCIFPEGTRSRTGYLDNRDFNYGVGQIAQRVDDLGVLCIYLRGAGQERYGGVPARGERLHLRLSLQHPHTDQRGLRGARDLAQQIMAALGNLERQHFAALDPQRLALLQSAAGDDRAATA